MTAEEKQYAFVPEVEVAKRKQAEEEIRKSKLTAEWKLKEWYKECEPQPPALEMGRDGFVIASYGSSGVYIAPEHIDLIANLVVERLIEVLK